MKLVFVILLFLNLPANATKYYVAKNGIDANAGTSGRMAWKTAAKVNSFIFGKNDSILFNRGDTFYGRLVVSRDNLYYGAYGKGVNPVITGFTSVTAWLNLSANIWESSSAVSNLDNCNMVSINGFNTAMGRYPNAGYLTIDSRENSKSLSHMGLTGNYSGAELVVRIRRYGIDRNIITSQSGDTLNFTTVDNGTVTPIKGWGFFIQNDSLTLDTANEWYFNPLTKKIRVYNTIHPTGVQVASIDTLVYIQGYNYITFEDISFVGSNKISIKSYAGNHITIQNCNINFSGLSGIDIGSVSSSKKSKKCLINNCKVYNSNDVGIINNNTDSITITSNLVKNSSVYPGMGSTYRISPITQLQTTGVGEGITSVGADAVINYNVVDSSGYCGIFFNGDSVQVKYNHVNTYCFTMDDGGGIYTYSNEPKRIWKTRTIQNNIVENGIGAPGGTILHPGYDRQADGIYLDAYNSNFNVVGNTIMNNNYGIRSGGNHEVVIDENTLYNNEFGIGIFNSSSAVPMTNYVFTNNIIYSKKTSNPLVNGTQLWIYLQKLPDSIPSPTFRFDYTKFDHNYYASSTPDTNLIEVIHGHVGTLYKLSGWKTMAAQEANSQVKPAGIMPLTATLYYNATKSDTTISLSGTHIDVKGNIYHNNVIIPPFQSRLLWAMR